MERRVARRRNTAIRPPLRSRGSAADKRPLAAAHRGPKLGPAHSPAHCLIVQFIKRLEEEEEEEEEGCGRAPGLCTQLALMRLCELASSRR